MDDDGRSKRDRDGPGGSESRATDRPPRTDSDTDAGGTRDCPAAKGHGQEGPRGIGIDRMAEQRRKRAERELGPATVQRMEDEGELAPDPSGFRRDARDLARRLSGDGSEGADVGKGDGSSTRGDSTDQFQRMERETGANADGHDGSSNGSPRRGEASGSSGGTVRIDRVRSLPTAIKSEYGVRKRRVNDGNGGKITKRRREITGVLSGAKPGDRKVGGFHPGTRKSRPQTETPGSNQGDHTTAYSLIEDIVKSNLRGATDQEAGKNVQELASAIRGLPGMNVDEGDLNERRKQKRRNVEEQADQIQSGPSAPTDVDVDLQAGRLVNMLNEVPFSSFGRSANPGGDTERKAMQQIGGLGESPTLDDIKGPASDLFDYQPRQKQNPSTAANAVLQHVRKVRLHRKFGPALGDAGNQKALAKHLVDAGHLDSSNRNPTRTQKQNRQPGSTVQLHDANERRRILEMIYGAIDSGDTHVGKRSDEGGEGSPD